MIQSPTSSLCIARMAELVDAADLKSADREVVPVRFRLRAPSMHSPWVAIPRLSAARLGSSDAGAWLLRVDSPGQLGIEVESGFPPTREFRHCPSLTLHGGTGASSGRAENTSDSSHTGFEKANAREHAGRGGCRLFSCGGHDIAVDHAREAACACSSCLAVCARVDGRLLVDSGSASLGRCESRLYVFRGDSCSRTF